MLRRFIWAFLVVFGVVLSSSAWAITTNVTITGGGQPLKSTLITLHVHVPGKPPRTYTGKTDHNGVLRTVIKIPERPEVTINLSLDGGIPTPELPLSRLVDGGTIEVGGGGNTYIPFTPGDPNIPLEISLYLTKTDGCLRWSEFSRSTMDPTNDGKACHDPVGGGVSLGVPVMLSPGFKVMPFGSIDWPNTTVNFTFPSGFSLGTTSNWSGMLGVKAGPMVAPGAWVYGVVGVSALNERLTLNFPAGVSSRTTTVPGLTLGVGGAIKPAWLQGMGRPVSLFAELDFTWWDNATFKAPVTSPGFNYNFGRNDAVLKAGVSIAFGGDNRPPPPLPYPVK
jgi:hypothetical protein